MRERREGSLKGKMRGISSLFFERPLESVSDAAAGLKPEKVAVKVGVHYRLM